MWYYQHINSCQYMLNLTLVRKYHHSELEIFHLAYWHTEKTIQNQCILHHTGIHWEHKGYYVLCPPVISIQFFNHYSIIWLIMYHATLVLYMQLRCLTPKKTYISKAYNILSYASIITNLLPSISTSLYICVYLLLEVCSEHIMCPLYPRGSFTISNYIWVMSTRKILW